MFEPGAFFNCGDALEADRVTDGLVCRVVVHVNSTVGSEGDGRVLANITFSIHFDDFPGGVFTLGRQHHVFGIFVVEGDEVLIGAVDE